MDLLTFWQVVQRQRGIVVRGLVLTFALAALAVFSFSTAGVELRSPPVYFAKSTLFVTQSGFPWGRSALTEYVRSEGSGATGDAVPRFADPGRMEYLASLYAQLASSDAVKELVTGGAELGDDESYLANPMKTADGRALPLVEVSGTARSPEAAIALANRATAALRGYVSEEQRSSSIPADTRIVLPVITRASEAEVLKGVKLTTPIMLLLLGTIATLFVAFVVDNIRRQRLHADELDAAAPADQIVRTLESTTEPSPPRAVGQSGPR